MPPSGTRRWLWELLPEDAHYDEPTYRWNKQTDDGQQNDVPGAAIAVVEDAAFAY